MGETNEPMQNIKNFIRQGKQAHGHNHGHDTHHAEHAALAGDLEAQLDPPVHSADTTALAQDQHKRDKHNHHTAYDYNELATELVREERKLHNPEHPGLDNYQIIDKLGEGAFSTVHRALQLSTQEMVAIKIIKKFQMDSNQRASVLKEATILRQLNNDHIVKFVEFKEVDEFYYIIQELVEGGEIFNEIVHFTYLSENLTRHILRQVAEAVRYLHEEVGIVHRDIKPENLLFQPIPMVPSKHRHLRKSDDVSKVDEGEFINGVGGGGIGIVKLADFGLSKQIWYDNTKTPCGTVGYTAPEIVRDQHYSKSVDMWALGCVLYTMLCGFPPFYDEKIDVLTAKVAHGEYQFLRPWWDEISPGAKNCVKRLLTVNPKHRYDINQLLNDPWLNESEWKKPQRQPYANFKRTESVYSPAARALKDAFDISNAVHRIGEENLINLKPQSEEILEEEEENMAMANSQPTVGDVETGSGRYIKEVKLDTQPRNGQQCHLETKGAFELSLNTSTILNRRKNKAVLS